ncbi:hypothetical protein JXB12_04285 [candidate division KSB1 bacterium]|nr:hypothetical protein [candidate division KSB1 bacterium]
MNKIKKILFYSFDSDLGENERNLLNDSLANSHTLRQEREQMDKVRSLLTQNDTFHFRADFTDRVMRTIREQHDQENYQETIFRSLLGLFKPIAVGAILLLIMMMSYNIIQHKQSSSSTDIVIPEKMMEIAFDPVLPLILE